jgi:hypothetical protein
MTVIVMTEDVGSRGEDIAAAAALGRCVGDRRQPLLIGDDDLRADNVDDSCIPQPAELPAEDARLRDGPLFRALHLSSPSEGPLATSSIRRLIKRATVRAGLDASIAMELSGHSMRIGAAQDMMVAGFDALAIMQAGGWKSANVVLRYVENAATKDLHARRWRSLFGRDAGSLAKRRETAALQTLHR